MYKHRKSIRLEGYDYSHEGLYFVTIDLESKKNLLWKEIDKFQLNEIGRLMEKCWLDLEKRFNVELDEYIIMPNHFHGIIKILENNEIGNMDRAATRAARTQNAIIFNSKNVGAGFMPAQNTNMMPAQNVKNISIQNMKNIFNQNNLGNIIGTFKSIFVWEYIKNVKNNDWPRFFKRLWQRDYYERIIRNEVEYLRIKQYIKNNPEKLING
jgi:REP element-mobilizing transposase RayT